MDFGLTVAMRYYLWPFWHQFSLLIYLLVTILFTIAAIKKANAMRRRRKVFEKLEVSMLQERKDSKEMSAEQVMNYEEVLNRQLAAQGLKLERKPVISKMIMWQAIAVMIFMNIINVYFGYSQATTELKAELGPDQKSAAMQQYGVEFDEDSDIEIPFIDYLGRVWKGSHVQNVWVFDIIFILIILTTAASEKEYWREAWRLIKLRKIGIISFYIFMIYISIAILDSITWRNVKLDEQGNVSLRETDKEPAVYDPAGNLVRGETNKDIEKLPKYKQDMVGDPILDEEQRSLLDRIFSVWSVSDNDEQGYSEPFSRYTMNKTKLSDFRKFMYFDIPISDKDYKIRFELKEQKSNNQADIDLFMRWNEPVVINHTYKPIDGKFVQPPWESNEGDKFYKPKNDDSRLSRWWTDVYTDTLECDIKIDGKDNFSSFEITKKDVDEYIESTNYIEKYTKERVAELKKKNEERDEDQKIEIVEEDLKPTYVRVYLCLVAWNKTTGQPAIIDEKELINKSDYGLTAVSFTGDFTASFVSGATDLTKIEREKSGAVHLLASKPEQILFPNVTRSLLPVKRYHILGTSKVGKDTLYESMKGVRTGIIIGVVTTLIAIPFALLFGIVAGYFGGWVDDVIVYFYSVLGNIPSILLIAAFVMLFERGIFQLCLIMGITSWVGLCRLLRGETYKLREMEYVQAAEAFGVPKYKIVLRHLMPNVLHIVMISAILRFSGLVMSEVMLTYLQIGVGKSSWGKMIVLSRQELARDPAIWWPMTAAFILMLVLILAANLFGDAVQDALDPRLRTK